MWPLLGWAQTLKHSQLYLTLPAWLSAASKFKATHDPVPSPSHCQVQIFLIIPKEIFFLHFTHSRIIYTGLLLSDVPWKEKKAPLSTRTRISQFQMYIIRLLNLAKTPLKVKQDYVAQVPIDPLRKPPIKWPSIFFLLQKPCYLAPSRVWFVLFCFSFKTLTGQVAWKASKTMKCAASLEKRNFIHHRNPGKKGDANQKDNDAFSGQ